jgi:transketolase
MDIEVLSGKAKNLRKEVLEFAYEKGHGHIGGSFSIIEILLTLYDEVMSDKDKFILSKGHSCLPYYFILKEKGFNPTISGHPERDPENGIHCTTGSLGHGLPMGIGMAMARKMKNEEGNFYVLVGDAECQEGTIWESCLIASHHKLDNLTLIVDNNNLQTLGKTSDILSLGDIEKKFESFGCEVLSVDGHSFEELKNAFDKKTEGKPKVIIANTTKGKGVSYMENVSKWHTVVPNEEELNQAREELK